MTIYGEKGRVVGLRHGGFWLMCMVAFLGYGFQPWGLWLMGMVVLCGGLIDLTCELVLDSPI